MSNNEHTYSLRHLRQFKALSVNIVYNDTKSVSFLGTKIWEILSGSFKNINNIDTFKKAMKIWKPTIICKVCLEFTRFRRKS